MTFPVFAYQSLNANSSHEHNIKSLNSQPHTIMAHDHFATEKSDAYILHYSAPVGPPMGWKPSPAGAMDKGKHNDQEFSLLLGNKVLQISENIAYVFGKRPDLLSFGEVDSTHPQLADFNAQAGTPLPMSKVQAKACQNFSVYRSGGLPGQILGADVGWSAALCAGLVVVFVHVPNAIAKDRAQTIQFYKSIQSKLNGRVIDIVMGDTNQGSPEFTPECVTAAIGTAGIRYVDAHPGGDIQPIDSRFLTISGTNSKLNKKYDVAVYNTRTVRIVQCGYFSQHARAGDTLFSKAVTDHLGIVIKVEVRK